VATLGSVAGSDLSPVATCRQTVEVFLAPLSTAWERVATVVRDGGSHLSPDGGGLSRAAVHRLGAGGYGAAGGYGRA
jgi:hypothetical protein